MELYSSAEGGKTVAVRAGFGCPCFTYKTTEAAGWEARLQLGNAHFEPGTKRRVGFVFLSEEGAGELKRVGRFYLWEGRFIGEANVVTQGHFPRRSEPFEPHS